MLPRDLPALSDIWTSLQNLPLSQARETLKPGLTVVLQESLEQRESRTAFADGECVRLCDRKSTVDIWARKMSDPLLGDCRQPVEQEAGPQCTLVNGAGERAVTLLDRLSATRGVWELLDAQPEEAAELLSMQPSGTFIVASNGAGGSASRALFLRMPEGGRDTVCRFPIQEDGAAAPAAIELARSEGAAGVLLTGPPFSAPQRLAWGGSRLRFRDLVELIGFQVLSRDVLPCPLKIPDAFRLPHRPELDAVVALGRRFWTMPLRTGQEPPSAEAEEGEPVGLGGGPLEPGRPACSVRVTSEDGALCAINPLFLSVHSSESWQEFAPTLCRSSGKRGTLKARNGPGRSRAPDLADGASGKGRPPTQESLAHPGPQEEAEEEGDPLPLRRRSFCHSLAWRGSAQAPEAPPLSPEPKEVRSPHRVSWIEGVPATTTMAPPSWSLATPSSEPSLPSETLLLPPIPELDSLSVSSVEDEGEGPTLAAPAAGQKKRRPSSAALPYKVLHRLSAVGSALSGLLSTERRVVHRVQELAQEPASYLGGLVQSFVGHILRGAGARHPTSTDMLQEIRQMLSSFKGYLCESAELRAVASHSEAEELDLGGNSSGSSTRSSVPGGIKAVLWSSAGSVVEAALYKCVLKPLREAVYAQLLEFRTRDGTVGRLHEHQATMRQQSLAELGVTARVPDGPGLERIQGRLNRLHRGYSPKKKETEMLKVCKMLYESMNQAAGRTEAFGADDFLPVLTYTLVNCDIVSMQLDVEYMMELMDPSQLQGEGGYYLTTWFGALHHIANFQPAAPVTRQISIEAQHSIHQWHRRRTIHHHHHHHHHHHPRFPGAIHSILYVSFLEPFSNQKTISAPMNMTTASVCAVCAQKYGISDPEAYGLFLVSGDSSQLLAGDSCPQRLRLAVLNSQEVPVSFVYKAIDGALPATAPTSRRDPDSWTEPRKPLRSVDTG
ncbi:hypothetical protein lerEdw1_009830 [Lerista edwardsae]|nr:hypothetical protein lerEdw1_009830 [Lerista edwardsae]